LLQVTGLWIDKIITAAAAYSSYHNKQHKLFLDIPTELDQLIQVERDLSITIRILPFKSALQSLELCNTTSHFRSFWSAVGGITLITAIVAIMPMKVMKSMPGRPAAHLWKCGISARSLIWNPARVRAVYTCRIQAGERMHSIGMGVYTYRGREYTACTQSSEEY
jgi:hypothetical protein